MGAGGVKVRIGGANIEDTRRANITTATAVMATMAGATTRVVTTTTNPSRDFDASLDACLACFRPFVSSPDSIKMKYRLAQFE